MMRFGMVGRRNLRRCPEPGTITASRRLIPRIGPGCRWHLCSETSPTVRKASSEIHIMQFCSPRRSCIVPAQKLVAESLTLQRPRRRRQRDELPPPLRRRQEAAEPEGERGRMLGRAGPSLGRNRRTRAAEAAPCFSRETLHPPRRPV